MAVKSLQSYLSHLSFQKSLFKRHVRRQIPLPKSLNLQQPVFIIGSSRSGTSILTEFLGLLPDFQEFSEDPIIRRHMWKMVQDSSVIQKELPELRKSLVRLSGIGHDKRILEKTPGHSLLTKPLAEYFTDAKFIHIIRDGRDVASSMLKHQWINNELRERNPVFWFELLPPVFKNEWNSLNLWQRAILRWGTYMSQAKQISYLVDRYFEIRYEKFCTSPEESLGEVCDFLNINDGSYIKKSFSKVSSDSIGLWKKTDFDSFDPEFYQKVIKNFGLSSEFLEI